MARRTPQKPGAPRFTLFDASPVVECGAYPAKAVVGEIIPIAATAFREGHDCLGVELTLTDPQGHTLGPFPMSTQGNTDSFKQISSQPRTESGALVFLHGATQSPLGGAERR